jgi:SpoIID/LytB domain protein
VGGGWGHGIGLSQYGSYGLARRGLAYREILNFYFPGTQLQQLN